jgi:hypothetical protein
VQQENEPYLTVYNNSIEVYSLTLINFSFWTVNNFWVDQGYTWQYGYVNVTRNPESGGAWLQYVTMDDVNRTIDSFGQTLINDEMNENGSIITIDAVNFLADEKSFTSGNGYGKLKLNATRNKVTFKSEDECLIKLSVNDTVFSKCLNDYNDISYPDKDVTIILTNITVSTS